VPLGHRASATAQPTRRRPPPEVGS
jgi:hypothetical protein